MMRQREAVPKYATQSLNETQRETETITVNELILHLLILRSIFVSHRSNRLSYLA